ncbi:hypothetical protein BGW80DRAFT_1293557 [Lactifluus volemus]|nr:hypothetical protein BGW80DRAFT_1293557 [Lactifluus volemus]
MIVESKLFPNTTQESDTDVLVLRYGPRHVLVLLPKTYKELLATTHSVFGLALGSTIVFETSDLNVCQDTAVEIHSDAWEAIASTVSSVSVKSVDLAPPRGDETRGGEDSGTTHTRRKASVTPRRAQKATSRLPSEIIQTVSGPTTSYDDVRDSLPTDDLGDEELGSYDDDFDLTPAVRKGKGKSRAWVESDGEHDEEEGSAEGPNIARLPASYISRNIKIEPSFSIVPSPPKRSTPAASPQRVIRPHRLFSPKAKLVLAKPVAPIPPPAPSDEENEAKSLTQNPAQAPSEVSPSPEKTASNPAPPKDAEHDIPVAHPKFKPQLKPPVSPTQAPSKAPPSNKMLITIRHPPTEKENKFRVKGTHSVGRVLTSACAAFDLDPEGATLTLWTEEDGLEMSYLCRNEWPMNNVAEDGSTFNIQLAK